MGHFSRRRLLKPYLCACVVLLALISIYGLIMLLLEKIDYRPVSRTETSVTAASVNNITASSADTDTADDITLLELEEQMQMTIEELEPMSDKEILNILLIGVDARERGSTARSDTMIILTVDRKSHRLLLTSLMRDIAVIIPGSSSLDRLNAAHSYGGTALTIDTIEKNFGVEIDRYVEVDFFAFIDIVDELGGLTFDIESDRERRVINGYVKEINLLEGLDPDEGILTEYGADMLLTGKQALGYVRNRKTGDGDFYRTGHQREALTQIMDKLKGCSVSELIAVINIVLPYLTTDLEKSEIFGLAFNAPEYADYETAQYSIPIKDSWSYLDLEGMSVIQIDLERNAEFLQEAIYGSSK